MNGIFSYLNSYVILFLVLTILLEMVPKAGMQKYIRFFSQMILVFGLLYPVLGWMGESDAFLEKIQEKGVWRPLPLDEDTQNLVYGVYDSDYLGTPLTDEEGMPLIPEIENGYYMINESKEHMDDTSNAFLMHTQDVSVSIYDADNRILYHCALDK